MSDTESTDVRRKENRRTARLLREIEELAKTASLTGALQGGGRRAALQFNAILRRLEQVGEVPPGFFPYLEEDACFDEAGVAASHLAAYIEDEEEEKPAGIGGPTTFMFNGPIGHFDPEQLQELGNHIRENLPEWLKHGTPPPAPPPAPPAPPPPPNAHQSSPFPSLPAAAHPAQFVPDEQKTSAQ